LSVFRITRKVAGRFSWNWVEYE